MRTRPQRSLRQPIAFGLVAAAVIAMLGSAWFFRPRPLDALPDAYLSRQDGIILTNPRQRFDYDRGTATAASLLAAGGLLLIAGLILSRSAASPYHKPPARLRPGRERVPLLLAGIAALGLLAEANAESLGQTGLATLAPPVQLGLLVAGVAFVVVGLGGIPQGWRANRREALAVIALTGLALLIRVWDLNDLIHSFVDELNFATSARRFSVSGGDDLLVPISGIVAFPRLYPYLQAGGITLLGRNLAGLRLVSAIAGTLTVPALYLLARTWFDRRTALIAAALLATFPPHVHYSRLGLNNIADPLFGTLALALLARSYRSGARFDFALAGAALGLTQYFYEGGRVVFPVLVIAWFVAMQTYGPHRFPWRGMGIALLTASIIAAPVYATLAARNLALTPRTESALLPREYWRDLLLSPSDSGALDHHLERMRDTLLIAVHHPEASYFYGGKWPLLPVYLVPAFLLGIAAAARWFRRPGPLLLILWIAATSLGNSLMSAHLDSPRYVLVFPALVLVTALGLRYTWGVLWTGPGSRWFAAGDVLLAGLVVSLAAGQAIYYFGPHLDRFNQEHRLIKPYPDGEDAIFRATEYPAGTYIHLISREVISQAYARDVALFLSDTLTVETRHTEDLTDAYLQSLDRQVGHVFCVERDDPAVGEHLRSFFSLGPPQETRYPVPPERQFVLFYLPPLEVHASGQ